ncbi:hypothetical protein SY2F82_30300 [Streptomyces sp. Y2F8-2]|uniref:hypothetical protein n=1 Tax=Streptomyces sp. Y2F8-2 TaxID=2759675 RepID=UPI001905653F|nr:hypothetical protein [Streptomyces sp. Y2F8-2]GHK01233.1 hypothetical protein SY2F82_30300 [Streptomyces sp. Y2F8-2]
MGALAAHLCQAAVADVLGPGEIAILLSLLFIAVWHCRPLWAVVCGTLNGVALLFTPVRYSHSLKDGGTLGSMVGGLVFIGLVAGLAAYLCFLDYRRTAAVSENRREQRLAIAADLHDFVAHHATWSPGGTPATGITITDRASGSCFGPAESTMRTDAWRCTVGDRILDACFSPDSNLSDTIALCQDGAPDRMVELSVPEGFPGNNDHMAGGPDIEPTIFVLANGARCSFAGGGTATLAGQRLNYGCDNGGYHYGYPNKTAAVWTISYAAPGSGASVSTPITTVYQ